MEGRDIQHVLCSNGSLDAYFVPDSSKHLPHVRHLVSIETQLKSTGYYFQIISGDTEAQRSQGACSTTQIVKGPAGI